MNLIDENNNQNDSNQLNSIQTQQDLSNPLNEAQSSNQQLPPLESQPVSQAQSSNQQLPPLESQPVSQAQPSNQQLPPLESQPVSQAQENINFKESLSTDGKFDIEKLKEFLQKYLVDKFPFALPESFKEMVVKFAPIIFLIGVIISIPIILGYLGVSLITLPFIGISRYGFFHYIGIIETLGRFIFGIILIPGLFKRTIKAWNLLFYLSIFNLIINLISFHIASALIGSFFSLYFLFQCRSKYIN